MGKKAIILTKEHRNKEVVMGKKAIILTLGTISILVFALLNMLVLGGCGAVESATTEAPEEATVNELYGDLDGSEINFLGWQGYDGGESIKTIFRRA